jgi:CRISPR-associated protein Csy1
MDSLSAEVARLREVITSFIQERLLAKLGKLKIDDKDARAELEQAYQLSTWLAEAARRAGQIRLASHIIKGIHPDARGSNLYDRTAPALEASGLVGTYSLGSERTVDVVGNAAALDVFKFLSLEVEGRSLLERALANDPALQAALADDPSLAVEWCRAFASLAEARSSPASHTLGKQIYFPLLDGGYHLLAPLFPSSLVHAAQRTMREDRFGERAKAARQAKSRGESCAHGFCEYSSLAIRKLGGTKPQNISQLNSERYGENWLLASLPPVWRSSSVRPPYGFESVFDSLGRQAKMRELAKKLRKFLAETAHNNITVRNRRAQLVEQICDEAFLYATRLRSLAPGWSADARCLLHESEQLWLDPLRVHHDEEFCQRRVWRDWPSEVGHRFANWLNATLSTKERPFGDDEHRAWKIELSRELEMFHDILEADRD